MNDQKRPESKGHVMTNPSTGAVRHITAEDWEKNEAEYLASGFIRPEGIPAKDSK